ncbi:GlxA family transcriptional regulator [Pseudomonas frederiksbergensis]|uniref:AraC family transcriptional regulator n=1 Tax=Pseudomonas frederiksbergensis TaxID=104087 RepID=A0A423KFR7_9PSED|nr:helix-turn-helix domain-containing protein [Pseudomonas frederiksbergensis]RON51614.1 AraC family transcriptional regulator [Pseudomonas frederiksbergensis]
MPPQANPHKIAILAFHGVIASDLTMPIEIFGRTRLGADRRAYEVRVCGPSRVIKTEYFDLQVKWGLNELINADTVIVPGLADIAAPIPKVLLQALKAAADAGARIASICTGSFILAAGGLLDGLSATTHWLAAPGLAARYPAIAVDPNVLFIDNGQVLTSAGACAGFDLCLHMIRNDHGAAVAADTARLVVMPLERAGGQAQFIVHEPLESTGSLQPLQRWIEQELDQPLTLEQMADKASISTRTLSRRFREQFGVTPLQWLLHARVRRAQWILETTQISVEQVALKSGFGSPTSLREHFRRVLGTSPQAYRNAFSNGRA